MGAGLNAERQEFETNLAGVVKQATKSRHANAKDAFALGTLWKLYAEHPDWCVEAIKGTRYQWADASDLARKGLWHAVMSQPVAVRTALAGPALDALCRNFVDAPSVVRLNDGTRDSKRVWSPATSWPHQRDWLVARGTSCETILQQAGQSMAYYAMRLAQRRDMTLLNTLLEDARIMPDGQALKTEIMREWMREAVGDQPGFRLKEALDLMVEQGVDIHQLQAGRTPLEILCARMPENYPNSQAKANRKVAIGALLDQAADWTAVKLDGVEDPVRTQIQEHPWVVRGRLAQEAQRAHVPEGPRLKI